MILGLGASCSDWVGFLHDAPEVYNAEVWTVNAGAIAFRHDVLFDMHSEGWIYGLKEPVLTRALSRREWLKTHNKPILMPKALPEFPTSVTYPLKLVVEGAKTDYFTNTVAYMLGLAYICGVKQVMMFGCDYTAERHDGSLMTENGRCCAEYWIGRLIEAGAQVFTTTKSSLLDSDKRYKGDIYGYDEKLVTKPGPAGTPIFVGPDYMPPRPQAELKLEGTGLGPVTSEVVKLPMPFSIVRGDDHANQ